jgi:gamma-glutamyltranspeptidase/glutathione hydrolase
MKLRSGLAALAAALLAVQPLAILPAAAQTQQLLNYPSIHQPTVAEGGMVVSQNQTASLVGARILKQGGNAVDAAVATAFALAVTLPRAGNLGGDGFMLIHLAKGGRNIFIDYRSVAPLAARPELFLDAAGKENEAASRGYRAPSVPGTVAGLHLAQRKYGSLPWAKVVQPAVDLAEKGFALSHDEAWVFTWAHDRLQTSQAGRRAFFKPDGSFYKAGEIWRQPELAATLKAIRDGGADALYKGPLARRFAADMKVHGGLITEADLAAYRAVERTPLTGSYRGHTIVTAPPASAGGVTILEALNLLERFDLGAKGAGSAASLHLIAEALRLSNSDRYRFVGDMDFVKVPLAGLTSKAYAEARAKLIDPDKAMPASRDDAGDPARYESPNTTHFSVADAEGNSVSNTYTLGADFGSGVMVDGLGFLLNNQMNNFSHEQALKARATGAPLPPNTMAPGKRMLSTMVPTIVLRDGKPWLVTGSPGGGTIIGTVLQTLVDVIDFRLNIAEATHIPRIHQANGETIELEPNFNPDTARLLVAMGHKVKPSQTMGSTQSIMIEDGKFLGAADPRRPGALAVGVDSLR